MSLQVSGRQVVRWTLRIIPGSALYPKISGKQHVRHSLYACRKLCSGHIPGTQQHTANSTNLSSLPSNELNLQSLTDMGFTEQQAKEIYERPASQGGHFGKDELSTLTELFVLGLNPSTVLKVLNKCPELYSVRGSHLQERIKNLRKLGMLEGSLQRVVSHYPEILVLPRRKINAMARFLKEKCLFTADQVTDILRHSPAILHEDVQQLEFKFQYAFFRMGARQAEMVRSRLFKVSLEEICCRHCFLERRGLYQTPDKKGQTAVVNPKLGFLCVAEDTFLSGVARATAEEFEIFRKLLARERKERVEQWPSQEGDSEEEEGEDEEEEEEEEDFRDAYKKKKR